MASDFDSAARQWLLDDFSALELFELAAEHADVAELIGEWLRSDSDADRAALFAEIMELAEQLVIEVEMDF